MQSQLARIKGIAVMTVGVRLADEPAPVLQHEPVIGAEPGLGRQGQMIVIQDRDILIAEKFFPVGGLVQTGPLVALAGDHQQNRQFLAEFLAQIFGEIFLVGGVHRQRAGAAARALPDNLDGGGDPFAGDGWIACLPGRAAAVNLFRPLGVFHHGEDTGVAGLGRGGGHIKAQPNFAGGMHMRFQPAEPIVEVRIVVNKFGVALPHPAFLGGGEFHQIASGAAADDEAQEIIAVLGLLIRRAAAMLQRIQSLAGLQIIERDAIGKSIIGIDAQDGQTPFTGVEVAVRADGKFRARRRHKHFVTVVAVIDRRSHADQ